jgi:branched-chain amino acid transport system ATP-binding protein
MTVLEAHGVTLQYGSVRAVHDVNLTVSAGELHGVIGPNGAGKSSLMDALTGRRRISAGKVLLQGQDITTRSVIWRRRNGLSRSFQRTSVFGSMTVRAQLELVARRTGEKDLDAVVETLGLEPFLDEICKTISYGDQRSVDIAMALLGQPAVILLDEPGAGLTTEECARTLDHIRSICSARGVAALLVEHDVDGIFRVCDTVTVLNLGTVLATGEPREVRANPDVVRAYLGTAA